MRCDGWKVLSVSDTQVENDGSGVDGALDSVCESDDADFESGFDSDSDVIDISASAGTG